jgi:hypothetical protein
VAAAASSSSSRRAAMHRITMDNLVIIVIVVFTFPEIIANQLIPENQSGIINLRCHFLIVEAGSEVKA